jgi:hypothetical protein
VGVELADDMMFSMLAAETEFVRVIEARVVVLLGDEGGMRRLLNVDDGG